MSKKKQSRAKDLWAAKMRVFKLRCQYFTSVTVQFILLKLFFKKKQKKKRLCLLIWKESSGNTLIAVPSALMHSQKALKTNKNNVSKIYPEYI